MKVKYKGYTATQNNYNLVVISKDEIVESEISCSKRLSVRELRILINKHIKERREIE